jgi:hypothetical protein
MTTAITPDTTKARNGLQSEPVKVDAQYLTLLTGEASKLSTKSSGRIGFEIAQQVESKQPYLRLTTNSSAGLFSKKWIKISDIVELLNDNKEGKPFKSSLFSTLLSGSSNNVSFISAVLRCSDIGFIKPCDKNLFLHLVSDDLDNQFSRISKLKPSPDPSIKRTVDKKQKVATLQ